MSVIFAEENNQTMSKEYTEEDMIEFANFAHVGINHDQCATHVPGLFKEWKQSSEAAAKHKEVMRLEFDFKWKECNLRWGDDITVKETIKLTTYLFMYRFAEKFGRGLYWIDKHNTIGEAIDDPGDLELTGIGFASLETARACLKQLQDEYSKGLGIRQRPQTDTTTLRKKQG